MVAPCAIMQPNRPRPPQPAPLAPPSATPPPVAKDAKVLCTVHIESTRQSRPRSFSLITVLESRRKLKHADKMGVFRVSVRVSICLSLCQETIRTVMPLYYSYILGPFAQTPCKGLADCAGGSRSGQDLPMYNVPAGRRPFDSASFQKSLHFVSSHLAIASAKPSTERTHNVLRPGVFLSCEVRLVVPASGAAYLELCTTAVRRAACRLRLLRVVVCTSTRMSR